MIFNVKCLEDKLKGRIFVGELRNVQKERSGTILIFGIAPNH